MDPRDREGSDLHYTAEFAKKDRLLCVSPPPDQRYGANYCAIKNQASHPWQAAAARLFSET